MKASECCPCGSGALLDDCCGRWMDGNAEAPTAEALMRSRYTAYVLEKHDYLLKTWHSTTRPEKDALGGTSLHWIGLDIVRTEQGERQDTSGFVKGMKSKQSPPLGLVAEHLRDCPASPNCVSSEASENDAEHYIEAIPVRAGKAWVNIASAIENLGGHIVVNDGQYLHATFTSALFRYVDDVEARLDASEHIIHLRSASRVGHSDLGVNRKRIESIRTRLP